MARTAEQYSGEWKANRNFNFRNLECEKGERLPAAWQGSPQIKWLKEHYGADCVIHVPHRDKREKIGKEQPRPMTATPPAGPKRAGK